MEFKRINWPGLVCAITGAALLALSLLYAAPWWQVAIGDGVGQVEISPLDYKANLLGTSLEIPFIWFLNLISKLTMAAFAIAMFTYSVLTQKPFAKKLLGFAYKKPILMLVLFVGMLAVSTFAVGAFLGINVPLAGTTTLSLPPKGTTMSFLSAEGVKVNIPVSTSFTWVFWLAVITTVLAVAARIYEWKVLKTPSAQASKNKTEQPTKKQK